MEHFPIELFLVIFEHFLPPLVYGTTAAADMPLEEQVKLFKNLVACQLVCRRWRKIVERSFLLFRHAYHVTEGDPVLGDGLRVKGKHVKQIVVGKARSIVSAFDSVISACPNVAHVSWTCEIPCNRYPNQVFYPPLQHLRRLDWRFSGDFENSVKSFIKLVQHSPVLEYLTVTEDPEAPLNGCWGIRFSIPDSVTTLGVFCHPHHPQGWRLLRWVRSNWGSRMPLKHIITSGQLPRFGFTTIELRPDQSSTTKPVESPFEDFIRDLPQDRSGKLTLIYSCTTYAPPVRYDLISQECGRLVDKIALMTSGSSYENEGEKWDAVEGHLDCILKKFQNLTSVDLCDDFQEWREDEVKGKVLETFEKSAQELGIAVEYIKRKP